MTATNHVLTGAVIGAAIQQPVLALPLAFVSHFACDALPHFGNDKELPFKSWRYALYLAADCGLAATILLLLLLLQPQNWLLIIACGVFAASPDLMWLPGYIRSLHGQAHLPAKMGPIMRFHSVIQWSQTMPGAIVEVIWTLGMGWLLLNLL